MFYCYFVAQTDVVQELSILFTRSPLALCGLNLPSLRPWARYLMSWGKGYMTKH